MKKGLIILIALFAMILIAGQAMAAISGSSHDLRTKLSIDEICVVCHVPHNPEGTDGPLWNRADHTSTVFTTAGPLSNACLTCHDGNESLDSYGGATGSTDITGVALFSDSANHHPIGVAYTDTTKFNDPPINSVPDNTDSEVECASCHDPHNTTNTPFLVVSNSGSAICLGCHKK